MTSVNFGRPTRSDLVSRDRDDLNARLPGADSRLRRSSVSAIAGMHAGAVDGLYGALDYVANQIIPDTADLDHLIRWASFWGVFQRQAVAGAGELDGVATAAADIPLGTVFQTGAGVSFVSTADVPVAGAGAISVPVICETPGIAGSAIVGTIMTLVSPIAGINAQFTVADSDINGADAESAQQLLAGLEARIQNPPKGGGPGDYVQWALSQPGVTRAWEVPLWMGFGTVGVFWVYDARVNIFPLAGDVTAMQAFFNSVAPVTAVVYAMAPASLVVNMQISLTPSTAAVKAAVTAELADLFAREGSVGQVLYKSHIDQAISFAAGETNHVLVSPVADVTPASDQLPVLGAIAWL